MNYKLLTASAAALALVPASHAVSVEFLGSVSGKSKGVEIKHNGSWQNVSAGVLAINVDGNGPIEAFCVDLDHSISTGNVWDVNLLGFGDHPADSADVAVAMNVLVSKGLSVSSNNEGAAVQLAVWDALYDGADGLDTGDFQARNLSAGLISAFNTVTAFNNAPSAPVGDFIFTYYEATDHGPNDDRNQNLVSLEPVPEPATMTMLGLGALAALRKRKKA